MIRPVARRNREDPLNSVWEPAEDVLPAVLGMGLSIFRTADVAMVLDRVQAYPDGCRLWVMIAVRGTGEGEDRALFVDPDDVGSAGGRPPGELVRFGVHYPDGTRATTLDALSGGGGSGPGGLTWTDPRLVLRFDSASGHPRHSEAWYELLLWPLPPAAPCVLVTEWPARNVPPTRIELDGAAIRQAALRAEPLWPDPSSPP